MNDERRIHNLETDDKIILDSGQVILDDLNSNLYIPVWDENMEVGKIKLMFLSSENSADGIINLRVNGDLLEVECMNFNEPFGRFTVSHIKIAVLHGKDVLLHVWSSVTGQNKKVRMVNYTLF